MLQTEMTDDENADWRCRSAFSGYKGLDEADGESAAKANDTVGNAGLQHEPAGLAEGFCFRVMGIKW